MIESSDIITLIRNGDDKAIQQVYTLYRNDFIKFAARYQLDKEDITDIYQDAIVILFENAQKGKLETIHSNVKSYLFGIGKYLIYARLRKLQKTIPMNENDFMDIPVDLPDEQTETQRIKEIRNGLYKLGDQCLKILQLFYYEGKNLDAIQKELEYSSKDVLKSQKSRCLKKLKDLIINTKANG